MGKKVSVVCLTIRRAGRVRARVKPMTITSTTPLPNIEVDSANGTACNAVTCTVAATPGTASATTRTALLRTVLRLVAPTVKVDAQPDDLTDVHGLCIDRDTLLDPTLIDKLVQQREALKQAYHTSALSCLHRNSTQKQRAPGVCLVRQLAKANGLRLAPRVQSMGYDKATGKKQVRRFYEVVPVSIT